MAKAGQRLSDVLGEKTATEFEQLCIRILNDASSRVYNSGNESVVRVYPEDRLRMAVANLLTVYGLLRRRDLGGLACFSITELGQSAAERVTRKFMDRLHGRP